MDVQSAIRTGDVAALRRLLAEDRAAADRLVEWGKDGEIRTHPLHFVCDMLFDGTLEGGKEMGLVEALLEAGADVNHQAANGETPLIGAASLGAEDVGLRLLQAGARAGERGLFGETALHWAALLGLERLVAALIGAGGDVNLRDAKYDSPPLGWARHGARHPATGGRPHHREVERLLAAAGATDDPFPEA